MILCWSVAGNVTDTLLIINGKNLSEEDMLTTNDLYTKKSLRESVASDIIKIINSPTKLHTIGVSAFPDIGI